MPARGQAVPQREGSAAAGGGPREAARQAAREAEARARAPATLSDGAAGPATSPSRRSRRAAPLWVQDAQERTTKRQGLADQYQELKEQRQRIVTAGPEGDCPTCARPLGTEYETVLGVLDRQIGGSEFNGNFYKQRIEQLQDEPPEVTQLEEQLQELEHQLAGGRGGVGPGSTAQAPRRPAGRRKSPGWPGWPGIEADLADVPGAVYDQARHESVQARAPAARAAGAGGGAAARRVRSGCRPAGSRWRRRHTRIAAQARERGLRIGTRRARLQRGALSGTLERRVGASAEARRQDARARADPRPGARRSGRRSARAGRETASRTGRGGSARPTRVALSARDEPGARPRPGRPAHRAQRYAAARSVRARLRLPARPHQRPLHRARARRGLRHHPAGRRRSQGGHLGRRGGHRQPRPAARHQPDDRGARRAAAVAAHPRRDLRLARRGPPRGGGGPAAEPRRPLPAGHPHHPHRLGARRLRPGRPGRLRCRVAAPPSSRDEPLGGHDVAA